MAGNNKTVYFVRHGQSVHNQRPIFQANNAQLSQHGQTQAQAVADRLQHANFEVVISSPLPRAQQTATSIAEASFKNLVISDLFVECQKPAAIEGKPWEDKAAAIIWQDWQKALFTPGAKANDAESYDDIINRSRQALEFLENRPEQSIVVVTHSFFLRVLLFTALFKDHLSGPLVQQVMQSMHIHNTGITTLQFDASKDGWQLVTYNDYNHLAY